MEKFSTIPLTDRADISQSTQDFWPILILILMLICYDDVDIGTVGVPCERTVWYINS